MRRVLTKFLSLAAISISALFFTPSLLASSIQFDTQGDIRYSNNNFTDIKSPYDGTDAWAEVKIAYWGTGLRSLSPYLSFIPVGTSESDFWWQRNVQFGVGLQWYPFSDLAEGATEGSDGLLNGFRFYGLAARRTYYDKPSRESPETDDLIVGADYYYDNLFRGEPKITVVSWSDLSWRETNFSVSDYRAFKWVGNVKVGRRFDTLYPHLLLDWNAVPQYQERWWENSMKAGIGLAWYPMINATSRTFVGELKRRFRIYVERLQNAQWLGDEAPAIVKEDDYRIGINFSTGGYYGRTR